MSALRLGSIWKPKKLPGTEEVILWSRDILAAQSAFLQQHRKHDMSHLEIKLSHLKALNILVRTYLGGKGVAVQLHNTTVS